MKAWPLLLLLAFASCNKIKQWRSEPSAIDPCDPVSNYYDGDTHFIERDFVTDDKNIDQNRLLEAHRPHNSPCDPLRKKAHPEEKAASDF